MNLYRKIVEENENWDGVAIYDRGRSISYPELIQRVDELQIILQKYGVQPGARIAVLADDSMEYILLSLAILALDAIIVPFSSRAPEAEVDNMLSEMKVNILITSEPYHKDRDMEISCGRLLQDRVYIRDISLAVDPIQLPEGKVPAFIRFSSGTTGKNKGVILSHDSVIERTDACLELGVTRGEKVFWVLDMAFHFVVTILLFLRKGACIVICPPPVESNMASVLREHAVSLMYATPYHYRLMTSSEEIRPEMLSGVRRAFSTAMKLENSDAAAFRAKFNMPLTQAYGIIEVGLPCVNVSDQVEKTDSVGRLQKAYELKLADADADGAGRVLLKGPGFFDAYLTPFRLRSEVCEDGYFNTGDIGRLDEDGYLFLIGRAKNVINFAGMKIFPAEVESVLMSHGWVKECRVSAQAAGAFGEVPVAEIVTAPGVVLIDDWDEALREYCYRHLAPYKVPKIFRQVADLPRTASGKILRK